MVAINYRIDHVQVNKYSRPGTALRNPQGLIFHYTANNGATAEGHQNYFDGEDGGAYRYAGAHIFVDKKEAVEIIPLDEIAYHANENSNRFSALGKNANYSTIAIEMCLEKDGSFHPDTIARTVLVAKEISLSFPSIKYFLRHYDVTGKICPKPFVDNPAAWRSFLKKIEAATTSGGEAEVNFLQRGDTGSAVKAMQELLVKAGVKLAVDGSFGPATEKAVRAFQTTHKLAVDGYYGPATKAKLVEVTKQHTKPPDANEKYRLVTGTFTSQSQAEAQAEKLRKEKGWLVYVQKA